MRISWLFIYFLTNLESDTPFFNSGLEGDLVGVKPITLPKYFFIKSFIIAIIFLRLYNTR